MRESHIKSKSFLFLTASEALSIFFDKPAGLENTDQWKCNTKKEENHFTFLWPNAFKECLHYYLV